MSTGMAWTEVGGELLNIEVTIVPGKGNFTVTGKLGEVMQEKAESIQYSDYNIVIFNIEAQDLETGTFEKMEEIGSVEYGDWNMLGGIVSAAEVTRIKEYFTNDLKRLKEDEGNDVDDCSQIYISVLYCKGIYVWSGMVF